MNLWFDLTSSRFDAQFAGALALAIGLFALCGAMLLFTVRLLRRSRLERRSFMIKLQQVIGVGLLVIAFGLFAFSLSPIFGLPLALAWLVVLLMIGSQGRAAQRRSLAALLAVAAEKKLPLAPSVAAFALEQGGGFGRRAFKLAEDLKSGTPPAEALAASRRVLPEHALLASRVAEQTGDLSGAWRSLAAGGVEIQPLVRSAVDRLFYLAWMLMFFVPGVLSFVVIRLAPSFRKIFSDFDIELPAITSGVIAMMRPQGFAILYLWLMLFGWGCIFYATLWYAGLLGQMSFGFGWLAKPLDVGALLRSLAACAESKRPLEPMVSQLAQHYPRAWMGARLGRVAAQAYAGVPLFDALREQRLLNRSDAALLAAAEHAGNLPWALRSVADNTERRLAYRLNSALQVLFPLAILLIGLLIGLFAVGFFLPIVKLITELS